jgi:glycosyltransferase involved in cell wall biosynthesis
MTGTESPSPDRCLRLLSVVIPARDEEGCICSTVEHLHVELRLHRVAHEILVVDDGSKDHRKNLQDLQRRVPRSGLFRINMRMASAGQSFMGWINHQETQSSS